jgi:hypothetical protein
MSGSNFPFVAETILRRNLDEAFDHILTLLPFTESSTYSDIAKSAFRKTIIIYTASIIEALLFYIVCTDFSDKDVQEYYSTWEFKEKCVLHVFGPSHKIVAGDSKKVIGKIGKEKMNLAQILNFLKYKKIIDSELYEEIHWVKNLRNEQHLGTHKTVKQYRKEDLEKLFSIARNVKIFVKNLYTR